MKAKKKSVRPPSVRTLKMQLKKANAEAESFKNRYSAVQKLYSEATKEKEVMEKAITLLHDDLKARSSTADNAENRNRDLETTIRVLTNNQAFGGFRFEDSRHTDSIEDYKNRAKRSYDQNIKGMVCDVNRELKIALAER